MGKISYLAFQSFDENVYNYELIGTGMILTFFPRSQRISVTNYETGFVHKDEDVEDFEIIDFTEFVAFAKQYFTKAINELDEFSTPECLVLYN